MWKCTALIGAILGACFTAGPLWAQTNDSSYQLPAMDVYGVVQSPATPVVTRYGTQHNLVTEDQIKQQGSLDFLDALRDVPGVMFQKKNLIGSQTGHSLYIRGRGASHPSSDLAIYFDDVPRYGALYGQTLADSLPVYAIGGLEVYKSPQPVRFGSGYAMVNVVPKVMGPEDREYRLGASFGSYGTFADNQAFGLREGAFDMYAAQSWISSDGYGEHSRAQQQSYYLNMGFQVNDNWNLRLLANYVDAQTLNPDMTDGTKSYPERFDTETTFTTLTVSHDYERAAGYLKFYYNNTDFDLLGENAGARWSRQALDMSGFRAKEILNLWDGGEIIAGFDLDKTGLTNTQRNRNGRPFPSGRTERVWDFPDQTLLSPYMAVSQYFGEAEGFHIMPSAGLRFYRHSVFADKTSPQAGLVVGYGATNLNFNYAKGVNYPTPVVLQGLIEDKPVPSNVDLKNIRPEVSDHYEVGLSHSWEGLATLGATAFYDDGKDRVRAVMFGAAPESFNYAANSYKTRGLELTGTLTPTENLEFFAGATWLKAKAKGVDGVEVEMLPYTPSFALQTGFKWTFLEHYRLSGDYQHLEGVYEGTAGRTSATGNYATLTEANKLGDINLVNLRLAYLFEHEPWHLNAGEVFVAVDNLFNDDYEYAKGYQMPGTTVMVGFDLKFN